jgi:hypothetical protein
VCRAVTKPTFGAVGTTAVGNQPRGIVMADFNSDGKADVAVANSGSNTITVLTGNGNGTFTTLISIPTPPGPSGIATADFNGDGRPDLAVACTGGSVAGILINNGGGVFVLGASVPGTPPYDVTAGDFDGDGRADIAFTNSIGANSTVSVCPGNGAGGLGTCSSFPTSNAGNYIIAGDFNNDGRLDLGLANQTAAVLLNNGSGNFSLGPTFSLPGNGATDLTAADFNNDGNLDMALPVFTNSGPPGQFYVMLGAGTGSQFNPTIYTLTGSTSGMGITAADLNGDGKTDLAISIGNGGTTVQPWVSLGNGQFIGMSPVSTGANWPGSILAGDFTGDGKPDLVFDFYNVSSIGFLPNISLSSY